MKKSVVVLALAIGFSFSNLNATNNVLNSDVSEIYASVLEVNPLCKAVATGDIKEVNRLIKGGADLDIKSNAMLPIHYAAKYNRVEIIKILITAGSKIHATCDLGYTALGHAKKANAKEAAQFLKRFKNKNV
ncbi:ankyrin repeat domain-containing protein [Winogradskyella sp.]|uniref:ankyrin repeat domain-containing protein n=1 Tax=Winogradskyella sp. TaxID=1883156 RepID=UPI003F6A5CF5